MMVLVRFMAIFSRPGKNCAIIRSIMELIDLAAIMEELPELIAIYF